MPSQNRPFGQTFFINLKIKKPRPSDIFQFQVLGYFRTFASPAIGHFLNNFFMQGVFLYVFWGEKFNFDVRFYEYLFIHAVFVCSMVKFEHIRSNEKQNSIEQFL